MKYSTKQSQFPCRFVYINTKTLITGSDLIWGRTGFTLIDCTVFTKLAKPDRKSKIVDRPQENQYYFDLYKKLAALRPKRLWGGAGGLSAINYKDGRKIIELAAESGLCSIAAGLESISGSGQKQSGAWRKLHFTSSDTFELQTLKENISFRSG